MTYVTIKGESVMRGLRARWALCGGVAMLAAASALTATTADASGSGPRWAPPGQATVHPGVTVTMAGVQCRAGYVLTDRRNVYLAVPASCSGVSDGQATDGCSAAQVPTGTPARIDGARYPGRLAYSSFTRMESTGVRNANECADNSLSLIRLDRRDVARTNPSVPVVGGPTGVSSIAPAPGAVLTLYVSAPAQASAMQNGNSGWSHTVFPETAITSVDVGAPVLDASGRAVGMVSVIQQLPAGPATVSDFGRELSVLRHTPGFRQVQLARGTLAFNSA